MAQISVAFYQVRPGQEFTAHGLIYRKQSTRTAIVEGFPGWQYVEKYKQVKAEPEACYSLRELIEQQRNGKPSSHKQKLVQKLWKDRGVLERTRANLRIVRQQYVENLVQAKTFDHAISIVAKLIDTNKKAFAAVKHMKSEASK